MARFHQNEYGEPLSSVFFEVTARMTQQSRNRIKVEHPQLRLVLWRLVLDLLKAAHKRRFPGRRFGPDVALLMVHGAALAIYIDGKKVRANNIARHLDMPHETVRRHLKTLTRLGLLEREDHSFAPAPKVARDTGIEIAINVLRKAASDLL